MEEIVRTFPPAIWPRAGIILVNHHPLLCWRDQVARIWEGSWEQGDGLYLLVSS